MSDSSIRRRISDLRDEKGLSQKKLAELAGVKQPSISDLETGKTTEIAGATLIGLARAFNVRPEWLLTGRGPREPRGMDLAPDELEMIEKYRKASPRWRLSLRLLADVQDGDQNEVSESISALITAKPSDKEAKAFGKPPQFLVEEGPPRLEVGQHSNRPHVKLRKK